jgi:transposase
MRLEEQRLLLEIPEQPEAMGPRAVEGEAILKFRSIDRAQTMLAQIHIEELIGQDHKARAIWDLTGRMELSGFAESLKTREGNAGRSAWNPRLLVSIWVYAYSEGISSAREIERLMEWEPGLQWLGGLNTINHHTLSDFRVDHREALDHLFTQLLAMLQSSGLLSLERVMHDGTKIRAQAGADTFRREKTLREHLADARKVVASMGDPRAESGERDRRQAARERVARERIEVLEKALREWEEQRKEESDGEKLRVSETEPEARRMKHGDNAIAPSYNAQITTGASHRIIVNAHLTQCASDAQSLMPSLEQVQGRLNVMPPQAVVDGGFTNRSSIAACAEKGIDLVGSLPDPRERSEAAMKSAGIDPAFAPHHFRILEEGKRLECPAGCVLSYVRQSKKRDDVYLQFQARGEDCAACGHRSQCCPKTAAQGRTVSIRVEEPAAIAAFREKMKQPEQQAIYKQRGPVAEFPHAWIKEKLGLRKFRVRGLVKAGSELLWACLTYNVLQFLRLTRVAAVTA